MIVIADADIIIQGNASEDELKRYNELLLKKKKSKEEKQELEDIQNKYKKLDFGFDESVDVKQVQQRQRQIHDETLGDGDFVTQHEDITLKIGNLMVVKNDGHIILLLT